MMDLSGISFFILCGFAASFASYGVYLHSLWRGHAKPHAFSWFNWGVMLAIGAFAQKALGGGAEVWILATISVSYFVMAGLAVFIGERKIARSDWAAFLVALSAIPVWQATDNPVYALIILISIDVLSFYPTVRKSWNAPYAEPPLSYVFSGLRYFFILLAVPEKSFAAWFYPFFLMMTDYCFVAFLLLRRRIKREA